MRRIAPLIPFAAALLSSCIDLAPAYHRPPPPTPATLPTGPAYAAPPAEARPVVGWREFFADPRLTRVIQRSLDNNRDLRVAVANIVAARAQYRVQRSALFPTIVAQGAATYSQQPLSAIGGGFLGGTSGAFNEHLYSLTAGTSAFELDLFGKVRDLTRAQQDRYFATEEARDAAQITLVSEVAADYLAVGADRTLLDIAESTLKTETETLAVIERRLDAGVATGLDLAQAETLVQQARFDIARLTTQIAQDRNALELIVGAPVGDDLLPAEASDSIVVLERLPTAISSRVLLDRPDVLEAEEQLRAANADIGAARAAFFPSIELTGTGGVTSLALSTLLRSASTTWLAAPTVSQTLLAAGALRGGLELAKAQRAASVAFYEKTIQTAFREVADALAQRGTIDEQLAAQQALVAAASDALRIATHRYERGSDTYLNVLTAQRTLYAARQTLVATEYAKAANLVTLYAALGGGLDTAER